MIKYILFGALAGALIMWLLLAQCNRTSPVADNRAYDSIVLASHNAAMAYRDTINELTALVHDADDRTDSMYLALAPQLGRNEITVTKYTAAKLVHDTVAAIIACDTLAVAYPLTIKMGMAYKHERDSLISLLRVKSIISEEENHRLGMVADKKDSLHAATVAALNASMRNASKRWSIGINAGYGVGKNGLTPYAGVGISYAIIKF